MADPNVRLAIRAARTYIAIVHCGNPGRTAIPGLPAHWNGNMSLNRHNPFVAALSTLVEPTPAAPATATQSTGAPKTDQLTFRERLESWAALGPAFGTAPDTPAIELPEEATIEATIEARVRKLYPYYY